MNKKIIVPVFASAIAISTGIVANADTINHDQTKDNTKVEQQKADKYKSVRFTQASVKDGLAVKVRNEKVDGSVQKVARSGETFKVIGQQGDWLKVKNGALEGWMSGKYMETSSTNAYVDASGLNFRDGAGTDKKIIDVLDNGESVKIEQDNGDWLKVKNNDKEGYVFASYITDKSPIVDQYNDANGANNKVNSSKKSDNNDQNVNKDKEVSHSQKKTSNKDNDSKDQNNNSSKDVPSSNTGSVQSVLNLAYSKQGVPYVWGAEGPNSFDCSGFTKYIFKHAAGINLPRVSRDQADYGQTVSKSNLRPGDLVFFTTDGSGGVSHVGIYIGGGNMIHSPSTGKNVKITSIETSYYQQRFVTAKRVM